MLGKKEMKTNPFSNFVNVFLSRNDIHDVFGVIIYTDGNPYTKKVLRDQDYWSALDCVSGPRWPVFAIRPVQGNYVHRRPTFGPGEIGVMVDIVSEWHEPIRKYAEDHGREPVGESVNHGINVTM